MAVAASMTGQINQYTKRQDNPFVACNSSGVDENICQSRPRQEESPDQGKNPGWKKPIVESSIKTMRINQPPHQNADAGEETHKNGNQTARHNYLLINDRTRSIFPQGESWRYGIIHYM